MHTAAQSKVISAMASDPVAIDINNRFEAASDTEASPVMGVSVGAAAHTTEQCKINSAAASSPVAMINYNVIEAAANTEAPRMMRFSVEAAPHAYNSNN